MTHAYGHWKYLLLNGREKKKLATPSRERVLVRNALLRLGLGYKETVPFLNPLFKGWKGTVEAALQWLDFTVWLGNKMGVILFNPRHRTGGLHKHQKLAWMAKLAFLRSKKIPFVILDRNDTSQIQEHLIRSMMRKENK